MKIIQNIKILVTKEVENNVPDGIVLKHIILQT